MEQNLGNPNRGRRLAISLTLLALIAAGLYGATLWRFGVIMAGGS